MLAVGGRAAGRVRAVGREEQRRCRGLPDLSVLQWHVLARGEMKGQKVHQPPTLQMAEGEVAERERRRASMRPRHLGAAALGSYRVCCMPRWARGRSQR
jgi:hypothetical protein